MKIKIAILISTIASLNLFSCAKDDLALDSSAGKEGKSVKIELSVKIPPVTKPQALQARTAAAAEGFSVGFFDEPTSGQTRSAGVTELYNLWLFQFNADGSIHGEPQRLSDQVDMVNDMALLAATLRVGTNQTLYLLALGKKVTPTSELAEVTRLSELENISLNYLENRNGFYFCRITDESEVPYGGKATGTTVRELNDGSGEIVYGTPDGFSGGIEIKRLVSRIQLKHRFDLTENALEGLKLLKVPMRLYVNPAAVATDVIEALPMVDLECSNNTFGDADKDANGFFTSEWYVAQNKRGTVAGIFAERDRYRKVDDGTGLAPELGTNIEAWSYSRTNRTLYTVHQIYVGNNNTNNFDVETNSYYNLRTIINSSDLADKRIRSHTAKQEVYLASAGRTSGGAGGTASGITTALFDAHYGWRPVIIYAQGRKVTVGVYSDAACTKKIDLNDPTQNWLKLSSYPNYTEVVRNGEATSLSNELQTSIFLPTRFKLYLYVDEYITNDDGSISDYTFDRNEKYTLVNGGYASTFQKNRMLYIKVVTEELGAEGTPKKLEAKFTMKQIQGFYTGLFGGDIINGQYSKGLIIDAVNEHPIRIDDIYPTVGTDLSYMYYGYNNVFTNYDWSDTKSEEENYRLATNGKQVTYNLATNPQNYVVNTGLESKFPSMRKINGEIDLYQYDYHKTYYARFCHDLNRDKNGNGKIDYYPNDPEKNELEWYLPSASQTIGIRAASVSVDFPTLIATTGEANSTSSSGSTDNSIGWRTSNGGKTSWKYIRCVRDIPVPDARKAGTKVTTYTDEGEDYVMLDLSNMPNGTIDRTSVEGKAEIYEELDLYSYSTKGDLYDAGNPVADASKPLNQKVQRVIKNTSTNSKSKPALWAATFSSRKFIVSPTDVYNDGDTKSNSASDILADAMGKPGKNNIAMTWAEANGRLNTANTQNWDIPSQAMNTGCYAYRGKNGTDQPGTWRTPNMRELSMIMLFAREMNTYASIGFVPLVKTPTGASYYNAYWCSTQQDSGQQEYIYLGAGLDKNYVPTLFDNGRSSSRTYRLRCIKDVK